MAHFHTNALIGASGADTGGDDAVATKSLRFNEVDSAYLTRTPSSAGNRKTWTLSFWVKLCGKSGHLISAGNDAFQFELRSDGQYLIQNSGSFGNTYSGHVFRDFSAWQHFVIQHDATNTYCKIYHNGSLHKTITASNADGAFNNNTAHNFSGRSTSLDSFTDFYLADVHFVDGTALAPTSFGAFDGNGLWKASVFSGSHGTNGFHLKFDDSSSNAALGKDSSGNNNTFTVNNISAAGQVASSAAVLNLPLNSTPFADSSASSATVTNTGSISTTYAASNSFNISTVASLNGSSQRLNTNNNNISFQGDWTVDGYFIIDNGSSAYNALFNSGYGSQTSNYMYIGFDNLNRPYVETSSSGSRTTASNAISKNVWYHIRVIQTGGTITLYINGTSYLTKTAQTTDLSSQGSNTIGSFLDNGNNANNFFGQLGPFRIINDALDAPPSGGAATNAGALSNTGTKTNSAEIDSLFDVPTNGDQSDTGAGGEVSGNYCTWNPLAKGSNMVLKNGNLAIATTTGKSAVLGTIGMSSGKWYWETTINGSSDRTMVAIGKQGMTLSDAPGQGDALGWGYYADGGSKRNGGTSTSYGAGFAGGGDVIGCAFDADNGTLTFYKNGSSQGVAFTGLTDGPYFPATGDGSGVNNANSSVNFGQRPFAYSAPSNHKALCTTNLPTPTIADGSEYFQAKTFIGNGGTQSITTTDLSPDFVWIKWRNGSGDHGAWDSVRGTTKRLVPNDSRVENTVSGVSAFNSDGFSLGAGYNTNNASYVAWAWDAGSSTVSNTDGATTANVRASAASGFSIVSWSGHGSGSTTIGHGLNAAPELIILKGRDNAGAWVVGSDYIGWGDRLELNTTSAKGSASADFNSTAPTNSVFTVGSNQGTGNKIAWCFSPVAGYSAFGSYEGNGSSDGPFIHTGFQVKWLMIKGSSYASNWNIFDTSRDTDNPAIQQLRANLSNAEQSVTSGNSAILIDLLSNGFKLRAGAGSANDVNQSSQSYVWAAFAENPFQANGGLAR